MVRLAKYIAEAGVCSRRQACRLIELGQVQLNGKAGRHIDRVGQSDDVLVNGRRVQRLPEKACFIYHKPVGIDCVCDPGDPDSILHYLPCGEGVPRLFPAGRLDKNSRGLMLLTSHGDLCHRILHPDFYHEKEYRVQVNHPVSEVFIQAMSAGVSYGSQATKPCRVFRESDHTFTIILTQGLKRQIRRMCRALGYRVTDLNRVRLMNLTLEGLEEGESRQLSASEVRQLLRLVGH